MQNGFVLITGASTGIGRACAVHLAKHGFDVLAGVRRDIDAQAVEAAGSGPGTIRALILDVTDAASISSAVQRVEKACGDRGLAGLVNNAGIVVPGPIEFVSIDDWRRQFEVNVFGQIAVTQAALPLLRRGANSYPGGSRIVLMGSIAGQIGQPILGAYCASKFALEAVGDVLRQELHRQHIQVCLVEPGAIATPIWKKSEQSSQAALGADHPAWRWYREEIEAVAAMAERFSHDAIPAARVADAVMRCFVRRAAPTRQVIGLDARAGAFFRRIIPDRFFDVLIRRTLQQARKKGAPAST